jgi:DNA-binding IclR family transcriptional regulator
VGQTAVSQEDPNQRDGEMIALDRPDGSPHGGADPPSGTRGLSTARAVLKVISFMARHPEGVTARDVAAELGKSVSTAYYMLASLEEEGFAVPRPGRRYELRDFTAIAAPAPEPLSPIALSQAVDGLFALTHRRSYLARVQSGSIVVTAVRGRQGIPTVPGLTPRIRHNAHALAIGKVVLSLLPERSRRRYIERGLHAYTPRTITNARALLAELDQAHSNRYAIDRGEFHPDYSCIAAPILGDGGRLLAVLALSTATRSFDADAHRLLATVRELAAAAGGRRTQKKNTQHRIPTTHRSA